MKLRKTPRTLRLAKAAQERKHERDGLWGLWSTGTKYVLDTNFNAGDIITIRCESDGNTRNIKVSDIPKLKNPKRVHPARKRKAKQMIRPITEVAQWISLGSEQMQVEKVSETEWIIIGTGVS